VFPLIQISPLISIEKGTPNRKELRKKIQYFPSAKLRFTVSARGRAAGRQPCL
jgi:hypothetical protein